MKIFIAQQNYHIGNFSYNVHKIKEAIHKAIDDSGDLIVFSELAICGYPPRDFLEFDEFVTKCLEAIESLLPLSNKIGILVGAPSINPQPEGKDLFNSVYYLHEGKIKKVINKGLLPNYDVFDEYRYFEPGLEFSCIEHQNVKIAVTVCEDIWDIVENPIYRFKPMDFLIKEQPHLMINLSASPFDYTHAEDRKYIIYKNAKTYKLPIVYCNTVGSQTEIVFDGGSMVVDAEGNLLKGLPQFDEALESVNFEDGLIKEAIKTSKENMPIAELTLEKLIPELNIKEVHKALIVGIQQYFLKSGFNKAIVASSGGIDSAVTLALACEALGKENVHALLMPSQFSTTHSLDDAVQLSKNLNNKYDIIAIKDIFETIESSLHPIFKGLPFDVTEENIQSRIRGLLVMALANKYGYILLNTSNKSELATGYGTLYGDMAGGLGILGDVYKLQVFELARFINRKEEIIPNNILIKPPSAELRPGQKDSDSLPLYQDLDQILYQYIELRKGSEDIQDMGYEKQLVERILNLVNKNEYKRSQFCPIIKISAKAFGVGRRMPIVAKFEI